MNELLFWLSARRAGSGQSFRSKVADLGGERADGRFRRATEWNLSKLGHAEFAPAAGGDGWRVAPPVLAAGDCTGHCRAVLCGARTPQLMIRLANAAGSERIRTRPQPWAPDIVEVSAAASDFEAISAAAGIRLQWNAPLAMMSCLVPPKHEVLQPATVPIGGWTVAQFDKSTFEWIGSTQQAALEARSGLFRFRSDHAATAYIVVDDGQSWACDAAIGIYRILKRRNRALSYSSAEKVLSIHAACRPPALVERALVLCSGELPVLHGGLISYVRVEASVAVAAGSVLGQRLL